MARRVQLEVFELSDLTDDRIELGQSELEECRLAAFEQGYTAGWDDAVAAQTEEVTRLRADLGQNLRDLSFTYHEAHSHVLRSLTPLLSDMVAKVLPAVARESLGPIVLEHLLPCAKELAGKPIELRANAVNLVVLQDILVGNAPFPVKLVEEPSLSDGQVFFQLGQSESRIDLDDVVAAIRDAVSAFFSVEKQEVELHG